jgi:hypothetical protein
LRYVPTAPHQPPGAARLRKEGAGRVTVARCAMVRVGAHGNRSAIEWRKTVGRMHEGDVVAFDVAEFPQPLPKDVPEMHALDVRPAILQEIDEPAFVARLR